MLTPPAPIGTSILHLTTRRYLRIRQCQLIGDYGNKYRC